MALIEGHTDTSWARWFIGLYLYCVLDSFVLSTDVYCYKNNGFLNCYSYASNRFQEENCARRSTRSNTRAFATVKTTLWLEQEEGCFSHQIWDISSRCTCSHALGCKPLSIELWCALFAHVTTDTWMMMRNYASVNSWWKDSSSTSKPTNMPSFWNYTRFGNIEQWQVGRMSQQYGPTTFEQFFEIVFMSRLFNANPDLEGRKGPVLSQARPIFGGYDGRCKYDKWGVQVAVEKLKAYKDTMLADSITLEYMENVQCSQLIACFRLLFHASHRRAKPNRPLSVFSWYQHCNLAKFMESVCPMSSKIRHNTSTGR